MRLFPVGVRERCSLRTTSSHEFEGNCITAAVNSVMQDIRNQVWDEFSYRLDVIHAAVEDHIEHM